MTMSDSLPKPLPSINALRAHLKLLERGVNDARDKRVGPRPLAPAPIQRAPAPAARPQTNASGSYQIPVARRSQKNRLPVVMVHGGAGQQGTCFAGTPDGRPGWADFFLSRGWPTYVVDQPGRGRDPARHPPQHHGA